MFVYLWLKKQQLFTLIMTMTNCSSNQCFKRVVFWFGFPFSSIWEEQAPGGPAHPDMQSFVVQLVALGLSHVLCSSIVSYSSVLVCVAIVSSVILL